MVVVHVVIAIMGIILVNQVLYVVHGEHGADVHTVQGQLLLILMVV